MDRSAGDAALLGRIGSEIERLRLEANRTRESVADHAGVGLSTLARLERDGSSTLLTLIKVLRALDRVDLLEALMTDPRPGPQALLVDRGRPRRRARSPRGGSDPADRAAKDAPWSWGDEAPSR